MADASMIAAATCRNVLRGPNETMDTSDLSEASFFSYGWTQVYAAKRQAQRVPGAAPNVECARLFISFRGA
jgi:hypothetical protein